MIAGITFNEQLISSADISHAYWVFAGKKSGITRGCAVTYSGDELYVSSGYMLSHGRLTKITGTETISTPAVTSGTLYCRLVYRVDLTRTNTTSQFLQGFFTVLTSNSGYPSITQEDLDNGGNVYDLPFAKFELTVSGIGSFVDERITFNETTLVNLTVAGWTLSGGVYTQTVSVPTVLSTDSPKQGIVYPDPCTDATRKAIQKSASMVTKITTSDGSVTFTASALPTTDFTFGLYM